MPPSLDLPLHVGNQFVPPPLHHSHQRHHGHIRGNP
jgi:hypothetical protein